MPRPGHLEQEINMLKTPALSKADLPKLAKAKSPFTQQSWANQAGAERMARTAACMLGGSLALGCRTLGQLNDRG